MQTGVYCHGLASIQSIDYIVLWCKRTPFSVQSPLHTFTPLQPGYVSKYAFLLSSL